MNVKITPHALAGETESIASKSDVHRLMICALLSDGKVEIDGVSGSDDIDATADCVRALGGKVEFNGRKCTVTPYKSMANAPRLDCRECGSTLRFMLPVAAVCSENPYFEGRGRLPQRPIGELKMAMEQNGASFSSEKLPFAIDGKLKAGIYSLPGDVSSQYISGLLMALSVAEGESRIVLTSRLQSEPYVNMTLHTLKLFGAEAEKTEYGYKVRGKERLSSPGRVTADGDWSNAAFFLVAGALGNGVTLKNLSLDSVQGDKRILGVLKDFGALVETSSSGVTVKGGSLKASEVDLRDIPDMLPALAVLAAFSEGKTVFCGGERLRLKESDRLETTASMLRSLGGKAEITDDGLIVHGTKLSGGTVNGENDHRIVMAAAVAAAFASGDVTILGAQAVNKSYPDFFSDFEVLGGIKNVI